MSASDADPREPVEVLAEAFLARRRAGEPVQVEAFAREHAEHAAEIRRLFPTLLAVEDEVPPDPLAARATVGPYRILRELGRGGAGVVYLASDERLGRRVALKVLSDGPVPSPAALARFRREAEAASRVEHAGICPVYDVGEADGRPYIAFRHVPGESLARRIRRRRREAEAGEGGGRESEERELALRVVEEAARAMHAAHQAGLVHRDLKPGNVMVTPQGNAVVLDFGLAQATDADAVRATTRTTVGAGTPAYMAPEQLSLGGDALDARTDVYALGATLYEALTLHPPFEAPTLSALFEQILRAEPERVRRLVPSVPRDVEAVVEVAMSKDRGLRYATALGLADDLGRARRGEPVHARPPGPVGRVVRWARRNPALAAAMASTFVALVVGLAVALALLGEARSARDAAVLARASARAEGLAAASAEARRADAMLGLLLAREAVRAERTPETVSSLHAALEGSFERRRLASRPHAVTALALDAAGDVVLEGTEDGAFVRHEVSARRSIPLERVGAPGASRACALLPGGDLSLVVDAAGVARLFDREGRVRATLFGGAAVRSADARAPAVGVLALLEDGRLVASDPELPDAVREFGAPDGEATRIESARSRPGAAGVAAALSDGTVALFGPDGTPLGRRREAAGVGSGPVALLEDDVIARCVGGPIVQFVGSGRETFAGRWRLWAAGGKPLRDLPGSFTPPATPPWSARGVRGILGDDGLVLTDAEAWTVLTLDTPRDERIERVVLPEDGTRLLTVRARVSRELGDESDPVWLRLWTPLGNRVGAIRLGGGRVSAAAFSADGRVLALAAPPAGTVLCATAPAEVLGEMVPGRTSRLRARASIAFSEHGRVLVFEDADYQFGAYALDGSGRRVWQRPSPLPTYHYDVPDGVGPVVAVTQGGRVHVAHTSGVPPGGWQEERFVSGFGWLRGDDRLVLATAGVLEDRWDERNRFARVHGGVARWRRPDGTQVAERAGRLVSRPAASTPRADRVVVERADGTFEVVDRDGVVVTTLPAVPGFHALGAEFSADGGRVLVRAYPESFDPRLRGTARLFDGRSGRLLSETPMRAASGGVTALLAPDGALQAVARPEGGTLLLDDGGRVVTTIDSPPAAAVMSLAFDRDRRRLAIGHEDGSLEVREISSGARLLSLPPREGGVYVRFTPDDRYLVTWTPRGSMIVWALDVDEALALADARVTRELTAAERERYAHLLGATAAPGR